MPSYSSIKPSTTFGTDAGKTYIQAGVDSATITNLIPTTSSVSSVEDLSPTGNSIGDQALVGSNLYIWNGVGWYSIALINTSPTWDSNGQPLGSYALDADSPQDATIITLAASDPDGLPITYSHVTSGSMDSMATISQDSSVFTITPKTEAQVGAGVELTGSITFRASDGVNILPYVSSFTLSFISIIENSKYTTLLATATDTSDNNNITDASSNNHTITVSGDTHAGTFSPYRHGGYSAYFTGSAGDKLTVDNQASSWSDTGTATIEFWFHSTRTPSTDDGDGLGMFWGGVVQSVTAARFDIETSSNDLEFRSWSDQAGNGLQTVTIKSALTPNTWYHLAAVKNGQVWKFYLNGVLELTHTQSTTYTHNTGGIVGQFHHIGQTRNAVSFQGYITDVRVNSNEVYTTAFPNSVPTERLTADSNTTFFYNGTGYIGDTHSSTASNNESITIGGNVEARLFVPYDNLQYSATDHGGSVFFPTNTNDYLQIPGSTDFAPSTEEFTLKFWYYPKVQSSGATFLVRQGTSTSDTGYYAIAHYSSGRIRRMQNVGGSFSGVYSANDVIKIGQWHYIEFYQNGASTGELKVNGTSVLTGINFVGNNNNLEIGYSSVNDAKPFISDLQIVKGADARESSLPSAPMSSVSNTKLLIKGTDASIIDKSQSSNLNLTGNTTGSTTQVKFVGSKSMYFDGTGDYLETSAFSEAPVFGTGNWTVEGWFYATDLSNFRTIINQDASWELTLYGSQLRVVVDTDGNWNRDYVNLSSMSGTLSLNTWYHFALVKNGNSVKGYTDGTEYYSNASFTSSPYSTPSKTVRIGMGQDSPYYWQGYLQDIRITKGLAIYTANFTPPTEPFKG